MKALDAWIPGDGDGSPVGCVTTTYTFDSAFFEQACLPRFLGLLDDRDHLAARFERERQLRQAPVAVLTPTGGRRASLGWDLVPVRPADAGLLHGKVTVLVWERRVRVVVGSANLTRHGYGSNAELLLVLDATPEGTEVPAPVFHDVFEALAELLDAVPEAAYRGARERARTTLTAARRRIRTWPAPGRQRGVRVATARTVRNTSMLDGGGFDAVWRGPKPVSCLAVSPYWDHDPRRLERVLQALTRPLAGNGALIGVVPVLATPQGPITTAPAALRDVRVPGRRVELCRWDPSDADDGGRFLHAKWLMYESRSWVAAYCGSANLTTAGLALDRPANWEFGLWIGAPRSSPVGGLLLDVIRTEDTEELTEDLRFADATDPAGEPDRPGVPAGFLGAVLTGGTGHDAGPLQLCLHVDPSSLPRWWEACCDNRRVASHRSGTGAGSPIRVPLDPGSRLPTVVELRWRAGGCEHRGWLPVNLDELDDLPSVPEVAHRSVAEILRILELTGRGWQPGEAVRTVVEHEPGSTGVPPPPPPGSIDAPNRLLRRMRSFGWALRGLQRRLEGPVSRPEALTARLSGDLGPLRLARAVAEAADHAGRGEAGDTGKVDAATDSLVPTREEAVMLLAEIALTVGRAHMSPHPPVRRDEVRTARRACIDEIARLLRPLLAQVDGAPLKRYARDACREARATVAGGRRR